MELLEEGIFDQMPRKYLKKMNQPAEKWESLLFKNPHRN